LIVSFNKEAVSLLLPKIVQEIGLVQSKQQQDKKQQQEKKKC
jgi:hypothetical protein